MAKENEKPICIMVRNKPQGADIIDVVEKSRRAFLGYPAQYSGKELATSNLFGALYNLNNSVDWPEFKENFKERYKQRRKEHPDKKLGRGYPTQVTKNFNLVQDAVENSIILVPRPEKAVVYCGTLDKFELIDNPQEEVWWNDYRKKYDDMDELESFSSHLQDVSQSWKIKETEWARVPFTSFPAWMRRTFFGRSTTARIHQINDNNPIDVVQGLMKSTEVKRLQPTSEISKIEERLLHFLTPGIFEHFMVALLQLENKSTVWVQTGGSGDGGIDGMGHHADGTTDILQCKWQSSNVEEEARSFRQKQDGNKIGNAIFAALYVTDKKFEHDQVYTLGRIAELTLKHAEQLPWCHSMRIVPE